MINETLRVRPVVPMVGRELKVPMTLGGYDLPAGTGVMAAIYLAHTRPDVFEDPYAFRPERFVDGGRRRISWIPFGGGTRRCIGASFAEFEMAVVLRTVLARHAPPRDRPARADGAPQRHPLAAARIARGPRRAALARPPARLLAQRLEALQDLGERAR